VNRNWELGVFVVFGATFLALAALNRLGETAAVDAAVAAQFRLTGTPTLDAAARLLSRLSSVQGAFLIAAALAALFALRRPSLSWVAPLFVVWTALLEFVFKLSFRHLPRLSDVIGVIGQILGQPYHGLYWFPSGHVARAAFLAYLAVRTLPTPIGSVAVALAFATLVARMYLGTHYLSDVLGGAALGIAVGAASGLWLTVTTPGCGREAGLMKGPPHPISRWRASLPAITAYLTLVLGMAWLVVSILQGSPVGAFGGWLVISISAVALWALRWSRGHRSPGER
jgi:undecaprenyl-diphosphatase